MTQEETTATTSPAPGPRSPVRGRRATWALVGTGLAAVLLVVVALLVTADDPGPQEGDAAPPTTSRPAPEPTVEVAVLATQDGDSYVVEGATPTFAVRADPGNAGGNLRVALTEGGAEATRDQQVCGSWSGSLVDHSQPGLALRVRAVDGTTRAITVTNNVFADIRWQWNVHTWVGGTRTQVGQANLFAAFGRSGLETVPWSMCARVVGDDLSFIAWPTGDRPPRWSDPTRSGHVRLPAGWDEPGLPGWYAGHLVPGGSMRFTDAATWDLGLHGGSAPDPVWPPA